METANDTPLAFPGEEAHDVGHVADFYELLRAIDEVFPKDATLYLEGTAIVPAVSDFLRAHEASERPPVEANTRWPKPSIFHLPLSGTNLTELRAIADHQAEPEVASHLAVYRAREVLLWAHDAGSGHVLVSKSLPSETIERFTTALGEAIGRRR